MRRLSYSSRTLDRDSSMTSCRRQPSTTHCVRTTGWGESARSQFGFAAQMSGSIKKPRSVVGSNRTVPLADLSECRRAQHGDLDRNRIAERRPGGKARGDCGGGIHGCRDLRERSAVVQRHAEGCPPHDGVPRASHRDVPAVPRFRRHARTTAQPHVRPSRAQVRPHG